MWCVCGKTDYTATLKVFRVRVLSVAVIAGLSPTPTCYNMVNGL